MDKLWYLFLFKYNNKLDFNLDINRISNTIIYSGQKQLNNQLLELRKTTGSLLRFDHTYKFVKCLGAYSTEEEKWVLNQFNLFFKQIDHFVCFSTIDSQWRFQGPFIQNSTKRQERVLGSSFERDLVKSQRTTVPSLLHRQCQSWCSFCESSSCWVLPKRPSRSHNVAGCLSCKKQSGFWDAENSSWFQSCKLRFEFCASWVEVSSIISWWKRLCWGFIQLDKRVLISACLFGLINQW